jgi:hypothetical protein
MDDIRAVDWVSVPDHILLMLTSGRVFHDGLGQLEPLRAKLLYYPDGVWLYLLAAQWRRIGQEEALWAVPGRSATTWVRVLIAARLVRDLMRLCFLMERQYAPYIKWFSNAFAQLDCAGELVPVFARVLEAASWQERQTHLTTAYQTVASMHNSLGVTEALTPEVSPYYDRPSW